MNNRQIVTVAIVAGIAFVAYLAWQKSKAAPVVTAPGSSNPATTPAGSNDVVSGIVDIVGDAWNDLGGLFSNQA